MEISTVTPTGEWLNFSRSHACRPAHRAEPSSLGELREELARAAKRQQRVRVVGSGHSYSDVALAPETQLSLRRLNAVEHVDARRGLVRVQAGITVARLRTVLADNGLGFANMGDTDGQSIAGALATGTHGTGLAVPAFSSQVAALQLMLADGSLVEVSEEIDNDLFRAARVSLGALGVVVGVTLRAIPRYFLRRVDTIVSREEALQLIAAPPPVDHFGVWLMPYADKAVVWQSVRVSEAEAGTPPSKLSLWWKDVFQVNAALTVAGFVGRHWPSAVPGLDRLFAATLSSDDRTDRSDNIFIRPNSIRHNALAYAVPLARGPEACRALLAAIERTRPAGVLPCEIRVAGADDAWLHPQYGRQTAWIGSAMHAPGFDVATCWREVEQACLALGGRPHWAKWHTQDASKLSGMYPEWARFQALRARLDPLGRFGSPAIDRLLGPVQ